MTLLLALSLFSTPAHAEDCDAKQLGKDLAEATPVGLPKAYLALAECDAEKAAKATPEVMGKLLAGEEGFQVMEKAIEIGAADAVAPWLDGLEPDQRSRGIAHLGGRCKDAEFVQNYLVATHEALGDKFFVDRWHRSLGDCRVESIQGVLTAAVDSKLDPRSTWFSVVEVYARNLGAASIPKLSELAKANDNENEVIQLVQIFGDAANVGAVEGMNAEAAKKAMDELEAIAPELPGKAMDQIRITMESLGDKARADRLSQYRWADRYDNGSYRFGVTAVEDVTCKNGKTQSWLHTGVVVEAGEVWPDQLKARLDKELGSLWAMDKAKKCKGEGTVTVTMTNEPLPAEEKALSDFFETEAKAFKGKADAADKSGTVGHEDTVL